jgi:hypothetical protein
MQLFVKQLSAIRRLSRRIWCSFTKDQGNAYPDGGYWTSSLSPVILGSVTCSITAQSWDKLNPLEIASIELEPS